jgi:hypothetical protein
MSKQTSIKKLKREQLTIPVTKSTKVRPKVQCYCKKCNGKWADSRTREKHYAEEENLRLVMEKKLNEKKKHSYQIQDELRISSSSTKLKHRSDESVNEDIQMIDHDLPLFGDDEQYTNIELVPARKERRHDRFLNFDEVGLSRDDRTSIDDLSFSEHETSTDLPFSEDETLIDDLPLSEDADDENIDDILDEQFAAPDFDDPELSYESLNANVNFNDFWILLWIFKYQVRFRLSDSAINSLIQFFKLVLLDANKNRFEGFPSSAYMARKLMGIDKKSKSYVVCPSCNKLFDPKNSGTKCDHVEFPNHPMINQRKSCGTDLLKEVPVVKGHIWRPIMIYPLPCLKTQLITMYQRPGFNELLQKWTNRDINTNMMSDIYDGEIWKNFPSQCNVQDPPRFFTPETADSHLGIMINLDWFQPFDSRPYSCGVIYGVICNLPRDVRFKKENMLILSLLPGPDEVKLHRINHYLAPIIDELLKFWKGVNIPAIDKTIRLAVICCSNDIPAARKLCGHISALAGCHRCYKRAGGEEGQRANFGGFEDMDEWFKTKDPLKHRNDAFLWKHKQTKEDRKKHVRKTHVRWSEMLRLPYHNPIRHLIVDPMHCLFLGIARWIVKKLWIDGDKLTKDDLKKMEKRAKNIKVPADLGRIPYKIATGEGFSGFTADQWKTFIMVYATPLMWDLLSEPDRKILANFVRACYLLLSRIIKNNVLIEAQSRLLEVARLIEENYGPETITPNIHLSLHITECCRDYGPLYSFWCYSFERMNGILGKFISISLI